MHIGNPVLCLIAQLLSDLYLKVLQNTIKYNLGRYYDKGKVCGAT